MAEQVTNIQQNETTQNPTGGNSPVVGIYDTPERQNSSPLMIAVIAMALLILGMAAIFYVFFYL
jgi:hypothetical protein